MKFKTGDTIAPKGRGADEHLVIATDSLNGIYLIEHIYTKSLQNLSESLVDQNYYLKIPQIGSLSHGFNQSNAAMDIEINAGDIFTNGTTANDVEVLSTTHSEPYPYFLRSGSAKFWVNKEWFTGNGYIKKTSNPGQATTPSKPTDYRICPHCQIKGEFQETPDGYGYFCKKHGELKEPKLSAAQAYASINGTKIAPGSVGKSGQVWGNLPDGTVGWIDPPSNTIIDGTDSSGNLSWPADPSDDGTYLYKII